MPPFPDFLAAARALAPRTAVVLGSGLGASVARVRPAAEVQFADVPEFAAPTTLGHSGRVIAGTWAGVPVLVFQGRLHFYEGNPWGRVTAPVRLAADLGVRTLILTNAAGGIRDDLNPGDLMVISGHVSLLDPDDWWRAAADYPGPHPLQLFDPESIERLQALSAAAGRPLPAGTYAALTGPCYETPAEIRALRAMGADAVGMSTVREAEEASARGLRIVAISCITNKAAGLSAGPLDHAEVIQNAAAPADRLANLLEIFIVETVSGPQIA